MGLSSCNGMLSYLPVPSLLLHTLQVTQYLSNTANFKISVEFVLS
jgi:hypothetical protein